MDEQPERQSAAAISHASRLWNWCKRTKEHWEPVFWIFLAVMIANWVFIGPRINSAVDSKITSPQTLENISERLRPYALIDASLNSSSATIEYDDHGAFGKVVDSVEFWEKEPGFSAILTFKMNSYVRLPLVQPLTSGIYVHSFWQTNKFDWAYEIRIAPTAVKSGGSTTLEIEQSLPKNCRFFVELLTTPN